MEYLIVFTVAGMMTAYVCIIARYLRQGLSHNNPIRESDRQTATFS
jgi:hypothetical protein